MSQSWTRRPSIQLPRLAGLRHVATVLGLAILLGACEGGSGQSGGAFSFLSVDGFFVTQGQITSSITSSTSQVTTTNACVILRNNAKNPTITTPNALDNITVRSYTLRVNGRTFTFGTAVLVPAAVPTGTGTTANVSGNTATFGVVVAPAGAKGAGGSAALAEFTFSGRDGRGQSVEAEGAVTVLFSGGSEPTAACTGATPTPPPTTNPPATTQ
jgi:hypothetical protein